MTATASFGAGCFWGVESSFRQVKGVTDVAVGYSGGQTENPSYEEVCTGNSGHAEVVEVQFDPTIVNYEQLLAVFFDCHDPTQLNRQGPDFGSQYRSAIFFNDPEQEAAARAAKATEDKSGRHGAPVVTEITGAGPFHRAEDYHQRYIEKRRSMFALR